ncbi:hypothetical protein [Paenibacillus camelliae]|uniref:hypothetical protein n=1 Tax=Paenibacillus camelliae TaxID=512410 RepID=UPI00203BB5DA|nr:hypothetical protein [Paenibacillus camelliae]MCM3631710.1 hypothetical protein [Paenibacillus camelliae]
MSRSWERKVKKNMDQINKQRKKAGVGNLVLNTEKKHELTFKGRNYVLPIVLIFFIGMYNIISLMNPEFEFSTMYWLTIIAYVALAALFFFRKPYLTIGKDYIQSRRMMGDKQLFAVAIKEIKVQAGYIFIVPSHGSSWAFNRTFNRFPIDEMSVELKKFADKFNITWTEG